MTGRIIEEFKEAGWIKPFYLGQNTSNPIVTWQATQKLEHLDKREFKEWLADASKIEKPRESKNE